MDKLFPNFHSLHIQGLKKERKKQTNKQTKKDAFLSNIMPSIRFVQNVIPVKNNLFPKISMRTKHCCKP